MRDTWYSDARDLLKWGALIHLATRERLSTIIQVAMFRPGKRPTLENRSGTSEIPEVVWAHFRDLNGIQALGRTAGVEITVIDDPFGAKSRAKYFERVAARLQETSGSRAVLLDPDTGFEPGKVTAKHVTGDDVRMVWKALGVGDWLLLYQHRWRNKDWINQANSKFVRVCREAEVELFRATKSPSDVILLGARKIELSDA